VIQNHNKEQEEINQSAGGCLTNFMVSTFANRPQIKWFFIGKTGSVYKLAFDTYRFAPEVPSVRLAGYYQVAQLRQRTHYFARADALILA